MGLGCRALPNSVTYNWFHGSKFAKTEGVDVPHLQTTTYRTIHILCVYIYIYTYYVYIYILYMYIIILYYMYIYIIYFNKYFII